VPDQPLLESWLTGYFPDALQKVCPADLKSHQLRREIVATALTNAVINRGGPSMPVRLADETGKSPAEVAQAYLAARYVFDTPDLSKRIDALDTIVSGATQIDLHLMVQQFVQRTVHWFLTDAEALQDLNATIAKHRAGAAAVSAGLAKWLSTERQKQLDARAGALVASGVPSDLARDILQLDILADAPAITVLGAATKRSPAEVAPAFIAIGDYFRIGDLVARSKLIPAADDFDRIAIAQAQNQVQAAQRAFTFGVLKSQPAGSADAALWLGTHKDRLGGAKAMLDTIASSEAVTVSRMTVGAAQLRDLSAV
jgi:glutamate dehydrogenase